MRRTRLGLVAVAVSLLAVSGLAGCDAGRPPAAKVGDIEISSSTLFDDLEAEAARAKATGSESTPAKDVEDTWSATAAAELLGRRIRYELLGAVLSDRDISITEEERTTAEQTLCQGGQTQADQSDTADCPGLKGYPKAYKDFQIELTARGNAYQAALSQEGADAEAVQARYDELKASDPDQLEVQCYVGATITDPSTVQQIQVAVAGGRPFEEAVGAVDGAEIIGGEQCDPVAALPEEVVSAKEGTVLGPFDNSQGGQFIVQLRARRAGTLEEMQPLLSQQLSQEQQSDAVEELLTKADVSVDPRFGRWDRKTGSVVPPAGPTPASTTSTPAGS